MVRSPLDRIEEIKSVVQRKREAALDGLASTEEVMKAGRRLLTRLNQVVGEQKGLRFRSMREYAFNEVYAYVALSQLVRSLKGSDMVACITTIAISSTTTSSRSSS